MKIRHAHRIFIFVTTIFIGSQIAHAQACPIAVTLAGPKLSYADDLIEVDVSFSNEGASDQSLRLSYPTLAEPGAVDLIFRPTAGLRSSTKRNAQGISGLTRVSAHQTLTERIYLQRFLDGFHAGHYDIPWEISVACEGTSPSKSTRGMLSFDITPAENPNLEGKFAELSKRARSVDDESLRLIADGLRGINKDNRPVYDIKIERQLHIKEAMEGLRITTSQKVIPFLEELAMDDVHSDVKDVGFEGLSKFTGQPEVRRFVYQALNSSNGQDVVAVLKVLYEWHENLPESDFEALLNKHKSDAVEVSILSYIGKSRDGKYGELLERYSADPDPKIANAAKQAAAQIK